MTSLTAASPRSSWYNPGLTAGGAQGLFQHQRDQHKLPKGDWILTRPQKPEVTSPPHADDTVPKVKVGE